MSMVIHGCQSARNPATVAERMVEFYDTHAHLDFPEFSSDLPAIIDRATAAGITRIISIGTDLDSSARALAIADRYPGVFAAVGIHPCNVDEAPDDVRPRLRELARHPKAVAIGETGLDFHHLPSKQPGKTPADDTLHWARQRRLFEQQLEVAAEVGLNCIIHTRQSMADVLPFLRQCSATVHAVLHCFSGSPAELLEVTDLGGYVSFTGILTFKNGQNIRDALAAAPARRFMLETDCPYLAPVPHRGKRCEPAFVAETAQVAASVRKCSLEQLSEETCSAAHSFFSKLRD